MTKDRQEEKEYNARDPLAWEEVHTKHIIKNKWIDFRESRYRFPDGTEFEPYYSYSRRDYVVIVPSDEEGNYLCVRQFRQGIKQVTTEFVAGGIERNDGRDYGGNKEIAAEAALESAKRELLEETGYASDEWTHLLTVPSNATIADNYAHLFAARNCRKVAEGIHQYLDLVQVIHIAFSEALYPVSHICLVRLAVVNDLIFEIVTFQSIFLRKILFLLFNGVFEFFHFRGIHLLQALKFRLRNPGLLP